MLFGSEGYDSDAARSDANVDAVCVDSHGGVADPVGRALNVVVLKSYRHVNVSLAIDLGHALLSFVDAVVV